MKGQEQHMKNRWEENKKNHPRDIPTSLGPYLSFVFLFLFHFVATDFYNVQVLI
jgi:hypothetical protein